MGCGCGKTREELDEDKQARLEARRAARAERQAQLAARRTTGSNVWTGRRGQTT